MELIQTTMGILVRITSEVIQGRDYNAPEYHGYFVMDPSSWGKRLIEFRAHYH